MNLASLASERRATLIRSLPTSGTYSGVDRFGRVIDQRWYDYGASADRDRYQYGYDRASNRLYRDNLTASGKDEFYTYDSINRLATFDRGDLNEGKTAISGTPVREEDWGLDMTGNWKDYLQKTSGSTDLDQDRSHNKVNEIADITETTGAAWATPVHDRNGNMTSVPKPSSLANSLTVKWDAWNRLVEAKDGQTVIGVYEYDGLMRRVKRHIDSQAADNPNGIDTYLHYFYNSAWQVLETRDTTTESEQPESLQTDWQYIWSTRYIDAPVLRDKNTDVDGLCDDERLYYLGDANFNVTTVVDTGGDAVERYLYEPYGKETIYDGAWGSTRSVSSYENVVRYTGREWDGETAVYHFRHRYYGKDMGTFAGRDRLRYHDGTNVYEYVKSSPMRWTDPSGDSFWRGWPIFGGFEFHFIVGGGMVRVDCTDRFGCRHKMGFRKFCVGANVGVYAGGGYVHLSGGCDPSSYEGYFLELGGGVVVGGGVDIGVGEWPVFGFPLPDIRDPSGTWEVGGGVTAGLPANASWCYYTNVYHYIE